jgi:hypothetical protein
MEMHESTMSPAARFDAQDRGPSDPRTGSQRRRWSRRLRSISGVVLIALGFVAAGSTAALANTVLAPSGHTASIRLVLTGGGESKFSGDFAGNPVSGRYSPPAIAVTKSLCPTDTPDGVMGMGATFTGDYGGADYVIHACGTETRDDITFKMSGEMGSTPLSGQATFPVPPGTHWPLKSAKFTGRIGSEDITGKATVEPDQGDGDVYVLKATMTLG